MKNWTFKTASSSTLDFIRLGKLQTLNFIWLLFVLHKTDITFFFSEKKMSTYKSSQFPRTYFCKLRFIDPSHRFPSLFKNRPGVKDNCEESEDKDWKSFMEHLVKDSISVPRRLSISSVSKEFISLTVLSS